MNMKSILLRTLSLCLSLLCLVLPLCSCASEGEELDQKTVMGTVGGREVYYDEIYYMAKGYESLVNQTVGEDAAKRNEAFRSLIAENVTTTYAMLALCEEKGLTFDEKELADEIDERVDAYVAQYFDSKEDFHASRREEGLTERYFRFTLGVELLYGELLSVYPDKGLVPSTDAELRGAIKKNFVHIYHLVLFNDEGDEPQKNLQKITEAHEKLTSGEASMYDLIKAGYSEDFSDPSGKGYYLVKGTMEPEYEAAAFGLDVLGISDVIESQGENNQGRLVPCYYVIQRFAMDEDYLEEHFYDLQKEYYSSVIASDMEKLRATLKFEPNAQYDALDFNDLPTVKEGNTALVVWICVGIGAVVLTGVIVAVVLIKKKHKKKNLPVRGTRA